MLRVVIFFIGLAFMAVGCLAPFVAGDAPWGRYRLFEFGLLLAFGAHAWPEGVR